MTTPITPDLVRHIGKLSRIALTEDEVQRFGAQLGDVLEHFSKLQQLDTEQVEPMAHAVELQNVLAEDVRRDGLATEDALANAPDRVQDFYKVPKVLGEGS
jgi:aspartyl-tRNA(Asn)/glutamyl-tRNA(Gln) amidotransferase subunit C